MLSTCAVSVGCRRARRRRHDDNPRHVLWLNPNAALWRPVASAARAPHTSRAPAPLVHDGIRRLVRPAPRPAAPRRAAATPRRSSRFADGRLVGAKAGTSAAAPRDPLVLNTETLAWFRPRVALGKGPIPRAYHTATPPWAARSTLAGGQCSPALDGLLHGSARRHAGLRPRADVVGHEGHARGKPPSARYWHTAALLEGKLIIVGGFDGKKARAARPALLCPPRNWAQLLRRLRRALGRRTRRRPPARSRSATSSSSTSRRTCGTRGAAARWRRRCARTRAPRWASGSSSSAGAR